MQKDELEEKVRNLEEKENVRRTWNKAKIFIALFCIAMILIICAVETAKLG